MIDFGTMSIIVLRTMLKYELTRSSVQAVSNDMHNRTTLALTDDLNLLKLLVAQRATSLELWRRCFHSSHLLLVLACKEAAKEAAVLAI